MGLDGTFELNVSPSTHPTLSVGRVGYRILLIDLRKLLPLTAATE